MTRISNPGVLLLYLLLASGTASARDGDLQSLYARQWIHGSLDCSRDEDTAFDVFRFDATTYILRQNKCDSFEAPFIYLLMGEGRALLLDTGAPVEDQGNNLADIVGSLIGSRQLLVVHSHSHRDHYGGDGPFQGRRNTTVVAPGEESVREFFSFDAWPDGEASIELVGRRLLVIPSPGHQAEALTLYDPQTRWLLTGDTLYPGYIYVRDWQAYQDSISRLLAFSRNTPVDAILGAHIEKGAGAGDYYPVGTTFQPAEAPLPLDPAILSELDAAIAGVDGEQDLILDDLTVKPMNALQKTLSTIASWLLQ